MNIPRKRRGMVSSVYFILTMVALTGHQPAHAEMSEISGTQSASIASSEAESTRSLEQARVAVSSQKTTPQTFVVSDFKVVGSTLLEDEELSAIIPSLPMQAATLTDLNQAADKITQFYIQHGFSTSRAILPPQQFEENGTVTLKVIEGWVSKIQINGNKTLNPSYVQSRLRQAVGSPLNLQKLESQLRLLKSDPMLDEIEASLKAGTQPGESILVVNLKEAKRYSRSLRTDNYSSSDGTPDRARLSAQILNPSGIGDMLSISSTLQSSQQSGNEDRDLPSNYNVSYRIPINAKDGAVQLNASLEDRSVGGGAFADLGLRSRDESYAVNYRQPLTKSLKQEFAISFGLAAQRRQTFLFEEVPFPFNDQANEEGVTQTRILRIGQDYRRQDNTGIWNASSMANIGLGVLDATNNEGAVPDGRFFSWQLQGQRVQRLGKKGNLLIAQGNLQLTPTSLLSSQQFNLGGAQSVRGFRRSARSGDNGWRFSLEGRFPVIKSAQQRPILQLLPFADAGAVWNSGNNLNASIEQRFLAGAGMGVLWQPSKTIGIRLDYGVPLVKLRDRSNGFQDSGLYFSVVSGS